jgi:dTDP-4-amino-4,6-dideoxygalactose transaminase
MIRPRGDFPNGRPARLACEGGHPVRPEFLVFGRPHIGEAEIAEVVDTLRSGWIGFGPKCLQFESDFARYTGARFAVSVNSATAALHLALIAAGVRPGDEVITTPLTFAATANVICHVGATPVFVDVDPETQNIDPSHIEPAVTERTRAIIPVHMTGWPCELDAIHAIAARHGLDVIEDAAHAAETRYGGRKVGALSRFTAFSFYATKNLTTAEGGMLTTDDESVVDRLRALRLHGLDKDAWKRYTPGEFVPYQTLEPGFKYNMTDLQASMGLHQLARLETNLEVRSRLWRQYDEGLAGVDGIETPHVAERAGWRHARHLYTIQLDLDGLSVDRARFIAALAAENIGTGIHFVPIHLHQYYAESWGYRRGDFPHAERIGDRTVSLPLAAGMSEQDARDVVAAVRKVAGRFARRTRRVAVRNGTLTGVTP